MTPSSPKRFTLGSWVFDLRPTVPRRIADRRAKVEQLRSFTAPQVWTEQWHQANAEFLQAVVVDVQGLAWLLDAQPELQAQLDSVEFARIVAAYPPDTYTDDEDPRAVSD